jgi:hypothetical protein
VNALAIYSSGEGYPRNTFFARDFSQRVHKGFLEADTRRRPVGSTERLLPCSVGFLSLGIAIKPRGVPEVPFRKLALFATRPPLLGVREAGGGIFAQRCNQRGL